MVENRKPESLKAFIRRPVGAIALVMAILLISGIVGGSLYFSRQTPTTQELLSFSQQQNPSPTQKPVTSYSPISPTVQLTAIPTRKQISGWKTYSNKEYGFSFKYPPEMETVECGRTPFQIAVYQTSDRKSAGDEEPCVNYPAYPISWITVWEDENISARKLPNWYYETFAISRNKLLLDGKVAYEFMGERKREKSNGPGALSIQKVRVALDEHIILEFSFPKDQILSSFQFIK